VSPRALAGLLLLGPLHALAAEPANGEQFPGQLELAAGLVCFQNLDLTCARARLEAALQAFCPERDPDFLSHLQAARLRLAEIFAAEDDLDRAEQQFEQLLLICPGFELPAGEHPPKVRYVFEAARQAMVRQTEAAQRPDLEPAPLSQPVGSPTPEPGPRATPPSADSGPSPSGPAEDGSSVEAFRLGLSGQGVVLFGEDARAVHAGAGAGLHFAWARPLGEDLTLGLEIAYAYAFHASRAEDGPALQSMSLAATGVLELPLGPLGLRLGLGLGAHAMGIRDRYDHWLALLQLRAGLWWPRAGPWSLGLELQPSLLISLTESSFCLPLGLGAEVRW
jgi:hypothetical protein